MAQKNDKSTESSALNDNTKNINNIFFKNKMTSIAFGQNKLSDYKRIEDGNLGMIFILLFR